MRVVTKYIGEVEIDETDILDFNDGLPGFPEIRKFTILPIEKDSPFILLQSIEDVEIGFILAFPFAFKNDYAFEISEEDKSDLQVEKEEHVATYAIVTMNESIQTSTLNLLAPIIINTEKKCGKQIILQENNKYSLRHPIGELEGSAK